MTLRLGLMLLLFGGVAQAAETTTSPPPPQEKQQQGVIDPKADAALRRMSDYLAGLKSLRVEATSVDEKVTKEGQKVQEIQESKVTMQRPNELRVERVSPRGHVVFVYDGKQFNAYNKDRNVYATAAAPAQMDAAIDEARDRLHIDAPGGDLLVSNPYDALIDGTVTGRYIGLEPIDGVMAHHIAVTKGDVDWQIWIKDGAEAVPLRYVITSKDMPAQPEFVLQLRNWKPNATVSADSFALTPPPGGKRVDFAAPKKAEP